MAFGGGSGFSFGSGNTNNQTSGFGGFGGASNNTSTGFGATTNAGFGSTTTNTNPFGGNSAFGSNTGGAFGSNTNNNTTGSIFGNKTNTFGTTNTTSSPLFGNSSNTSTGFGGGASGGGFGSGNTSAFGGNNTASNPTFSFGNNTTKPAFGASSTAAPLFGQGGTGTTSGFGSSSAFGGSGSGTALNQPVPPSDGTAGTPFNPTVENDAGTTNKNSYQSITFQQPYTKYSFEELRLADYNAGRRFGNGSGQAGAFGSSTFGGGFGSTNTNTNTNTSTGFGASSNPFGSTSSSSALGGTTASSGFGGSSLFGSKPTGSIFGQQTSAPSSGGLFGSAPASSSPFGTGSTGFGGSSTTPNNLFGASQSTQAKPSLFGTNNSSGGGGGFSFGGTNSTTTGSAGGGLFGGNNTAGGFGSNTQQPASTGFTGFGTNQNATQPKPSLFGGGTTAFGTSTTQAQPSQSLFGATAATGTGFLNNNNNTNNQPTSSLFGNSQSGTGSSLFGGNNNANNAQPKPGGLLGGSLFGGTNSNNNPTTGTSLFSNAQSNSNQASVGGLFGSGSTFGNNNNANKPATSLFGSNTNNQQGGGLFGTTNNGGSMFGNSQNSMQNSILQQDGPKHASQLESSPFTQSSIWTGLPQATPQNAAPLLTPLSSSTRVKESARKPPTPRLNLNQSRYNTPPARQPSKFGFTYSAYGTPNSAASTPGGLAANMYNGRGFTGGSFGRSLHKSFSSSSLRPQFAIENESVLSPGAFAPGSSRYSSGSIRRLTIDRSIRNDLFTRPSQPALPAPISSPSHGSSSAPSSGESTTEQPSKLKKRVSFDKDITGGSHEDTLNGESGALVRTEEVDEMTEEETPRGRPSKPTNGAEMQQVRGNELAAVPEDRESDSVVSNMKLPSDVKAKHDPNPGAYYMKPTRAEISKMPRDKLQRFTNFEVGRQGCGHVIFNSAVDLTAINLDDVFEKIVEIRLRSITVYPDAASKPPQGKGLNVPSTLYIENSWPRARNMPSSATTGPIFDKHVNRLKKMGGTEFVSYEVSTGIWVFKVPHYTRYGLDYDEDDEEMDDDSFSPTPDSVGDRVPQEASVMDMEGPHSEESSAEDDTFAFKQKTIPGGFGRQSMLEFEAEGDLVDSGSERSYLSEDETSENDMIMAGTFPEPEPLPVLRSPDKSILKPSVGTPGRPLLDLDGDWADQLQRTISPRKQNREALRDIQSKVLLDMVYEPIKPQRANKTDFRNSIDVMNSLFGKHEARMAAASKRETPGADFEFPYSKRPKLFENDASKMSPADKAFHATFKPHWSTTGTILYRKGRDLPLETKSWTGHEKLLMADMRGDIVISSLSGDGKDPLTVLDSSLTHVDVVIADGVPFAKHQNVPFSAHAAHLRQQRQAQPSGDNLGDEEQLYELAHLLFDNYEDEYTAGLNKQQRHDFDFRIRKDRLTSFLATCIRNRHGDDVKIAQRRSAEEAAVLYLAANDVRGACQALESHKDYHLMMLVAQIGQADVKFQENIASQVTAWREQNIISEMTEPIRALYEILAGNTTISEGQRGAMEDQATTFCISERFGLDWLQAFGLCLWYGKHKNGSVEEAVRDYMGLLKSKLESAYPYPDGVDAGEQESPLWVLLKLYASTKSVGLESPTLPQALNSLSASFDCQTTFDFHHALTSRLPRLRVDPDRADQLANELGFQLSASGSYLGALFALLHVQDAARREASIQDLLARHAANLPEKPLESSQDRTRHFWDALTIGLRIPSAWIFKAKSFYAKSNHDSLEEFNYLIAADEWDAAHTTFCRRVAPRLVIDEDWDLLVDELQSFGHGVEGRVADWSKGGAIYCDFAVIVGASKGDAQVALRSLQGSLAEMGRRIKTRGKDISAGGIEELEERVACKEMSRKVARLIGHDGGAQKSTILDLPLTADARLKETRNMAAEYYRASMVAGR